VFTADFNPSQRLTAERCPRCHTVGLAVPSVETCANTPDAEYYDGMASMCPSITTWCPACGLVGEWPAMCWGPEVKPKRNLSAGASFDLVLPQHRKLADPLLKRAPVTQRLLQPGRPAGGLAVVPCHNVLVAFEVQRLWRLQVGSQSGHRN
jgi:hypothetical protein